MGSQDERENYFLLQSFLYSEFFTLYIIAFSFKKQNKTKNHTHTTESASTLILDFSVSKTMRNKCCLEATQPMVFLLQQLKWTKTGSR